MRRLHWIMLCALLFCAASFEAQATDPRLWDTTGVALRQGYHIEWQRAAEMDENGNVIYVWSDTRTADRDVYAQKISPSGQKLWPEDGAPVVQFLGRQEDPQLIPTGSGEYIFIWNDFRNDQGKGDLYAQKLDANGEIVWTSYPTGRLLSTGDFDSPAELRIVADGTGGAVILWNDLRNGDLGDIYAIRVMSDGSIPGIWPPNGLPVSVAPAGQRHITVDTDGSGGAIVAWDDDRNAPISGFDIYIQRVTINAQLAWGTNGVVVCDTSLDQTSPKICPNGSGGAYLVWVDKRQDSNGDLYFQIISSAGAKLLSGYPQGKPLLATVPMALQQEQPRIVADGSGNAIILWLDTRNDPAQNLSFDIYAQKVNSSGARLWTPQDGVAVCTDTMDQSDARINADGAGGAICVWMDGRSGIGWNIYAQKINSNGSMAWTANGVPACEASGDQKDPLVRAATTYSMIVWGDERSGSKGIWHQKLNSSGVPLTANGDTLIWGISGDAVSPKLIPDQQGKIMVFFEDLREGSARCMAYMQVLDTLGNLYLQPNGQLICPNPAYTGTKSQQGLQACSDGGTGAIAIWQDARDSNPYKQVYAQRAESNGNLYWGNAGLRVMPYDNEQGLPLITADGSGGAVAAWSAYSLATGYDNDVYAAKISHSGTVPWTAQITSVLWEDETLQDIVPDGSGGAYLGYRGIPWELGWDVFAQHLDASGNLLWDAGVPLCTAVGIQNDVRIVGLESGGAIFVWEDARAVEMGDSLLALLASDIYAQKIDVAGTPQWAANGIPISSVLGDQSAPEVALDGDGNILIIWEDFRLAALDLYIQKITPDGQILFAANGIPFCDAAYDQSAARIIPDEQNGSYVVWDDSRSGSSTDIFGIRLDAEGVVAPPHWMPDGNPISAYFNKQNLAAPVGDYHGGMIVVWQDKRSSGKDEVINLYAQRANDFRVGVEEPVISAPPAAFRLYEPYPNPFNPAVQLRYQIERSGHVRLAIYDLLGKEVAVLKDGWQLAGAAEILWKPGEIASGIYFARLNFNGRQAQQKLLLMK